MVEITERCCWACGLTITQQRVFQEKVAKVVKVVEVVKVVKVGLHLQQRLGDGWCSKHSADGGASVSSRRKEASKNSYNDLAGLPSQGVWDLEPSRGRSADCNTNRSRELSLSVLATAETSPKQPRFLSQEELSLWLDVQTHSALVAPPAWGLQLAEAPPHAFQPPVPNTQTVAQATTAVWDGGKSSGRRLLLWLRAPSFFSP